MATAAGTPLSRLRPSLFVVTSLLVDPVRLTEPFLLIEQILCMRLRASESMPLRWLVSSLYVGASWTVGVRLLAHMLVGLMLLTEPRQFSEKSFVMKLSAAEPVPLNRFVHFAAAVVTMRMVAIMLYVVASLLVGLVLHTEPRRRISRRRACSQCRSW